MASACDAVTNIPFPKPKEVPNPKLLEMTTLLLVPRVIELYSRLLVVAVPGCTHSATPVVEYLTSTPCVELSGMLTPLPKLIGPDQGDTLPTTNRFPLPSVVSEVYVLCPKVALALMTFVAHCAIPLVL